jgi:anti-anti-sigma factor
MEETRAMTRRTPLGVGTAVEVRNHFEGGWSPGFHIVDVGPDGYRVARGDGTQLPVYVDPTEVRAVTTTSSTADVRATIALDLRSSEATVSIRLSGPLTRLTAAHFREVTRELSGPNVVVDLSLVTAIDDAGTAVLLGLIHRCREEHSSVVVVVSDPNVRQALQRTGIHRVAAVVGTAGAPDWLSQMDAQIEVLHPPGAD